VEFKPTPESKRGGEWNPPSLNDESSAKVEAFFDTVWASFKDPQTLENKLLFLDYCSMIMFRRKFWAYAVCFHKTSSRAQLSSFTESL
jgi:hypothetical protein